MTYGILCLRISKTMSRCKFLLNRLTTVGATTRKQWPRQSRVSSCRQVLERQQVSRLSAHGGKCAPKNPFNSAWLGHFFFRVPLGLTHDGQTNVTMMVTHGRAAGGDPFFTRQFHAERLGELFPNYHPLKKIEGKWNIVATSRAHARMALDAFLCSEYDQISGLFMAYEFYFQSR